MIAVCTFGDDMSRMGFNDSVAVDKAVYFPEITWQFFAGILILLVKFRHVVLIRLSCHTESFDNPAMIQYIVYYA